MSPTLGKAQVIVVEDADRVTERGADALLKSIEEPSPKTVWILCAPTPDDVVPTIRSRCRQLNLQTPSVRAVAELLHTRDGIAPDLAAYAARVAQGHIGRARVLARSEDARSRRSTVLRIPFELDDLGDCLRSAAALIESCNAEVAAVAGEQDTRERAALQEALGFGTKGARPRQAQAAMRDLEEQQKARAKRLQRDVLDRALTELTGLYRDVLCIQTGSGAELVNSDLEPRIKVMARRTSPEGILRRIDALLGCREALETNVAPLLALESTLISLMDS
jgi:DNA polymerase-3 subunit delta'